MASSKPVSGAHRKRAKAQGKSLSRVQSVRAQLKAILQDLKLAQSAVVVAVAALRQQRCELDEDIAAVLQRNVAERLYDQIDKLEATVQQLSQLERKH